MHLQLAVVKNGIIIQCDCKKYHTCKKDYSWSPSTCIFQDSRYLKHNVDNSAIMCDEILYFMNIVSTNMINTMPKSIISLHTITGSIKVRGIVSTNSDDKNVRYKINGYIHLILIVTIRLLLPVVISISCYYCFTRNKWKTKMILI